MFAFNQIIRNVTLCVGACLFLAACGDGWEVVKTTDYFPYGNQRTAGSGVAYVRAKMLPEHDVKLELTMTVPEVASDKAILGADAVFKKALRK